MSPNLHIKTCIALLLALLWGAPDAKAQPRGNDTLLVGAIVVEADTFPMIFLPDFEKTGKLPRRLARKRAAYDKMRYNIYKVYPYAVAAATILKDIDSNLIALDEDKAERKAYLKTLEKQLNKQFKGELENLTITQGQILVKLINRQTGKNCYSLIRELKGGFSAVIWQSVALLFSNNLKREYDPGGRDKEIEEIVADLEANYYYDYQLRRQQSMLMPRKK